MPFIYASSAATYGDGALGFDDDDTVQALQQLQPLNLMAKAKNEFDIWVAEQVAAGLPRRRSGPGSSFSMSMGPTNITRAVK